MGYNSDGIGYQNSKTSKASANKKRKWKITIRQQVLDLFKHHEFLTTEEAARYCDRAEISVQPRISELKNLGLVRDSGLTKKGKWGLQITMWELI